MKLFKALLIMSIIISPLFGRYTIVFLRLGNASLYDGDWQIGMGITSMIREELEKTGKYKVVEKNLATLYGYLDDKKVFDEDEKLLALAKEYNADLIITGVVKGFAYSSGGVVGADLGGVKYLNGRVALELKVLKASDGTKTVITPKGVVHGKDIGITLLGGPGGQDDIDGVTQMTKLQETVRFGSTRYRESLIGRATIECIIDLEKELEKFNPNASSDLIKGKILLTEDDFVYIDIGHEDNLKPGYRFSVYREGTPIVDEESGEVLGAPETDVATIEIVFVKSSKFSKAKIVDKKTDIEKGDKVRFLPQKIETEAEKKKDKEKERIGFWD